MAERNKKALWCVTARTYGITRLLNSFFFFFYVKFCKSLLLEIKLALHCYMESNVLKYNYYGPVNRKLNFEDFGFCGNVNHRAFLLQVEIWLCMSHFSRISWSLCNSRVKTMLKNRGNSQLKKIYNRKKITGNTNSLMIVTHRIRKA